MEQFDLYLNQARDLVWGIPLLALLIGTGAYLTFLLRGFQFRYLGCAFKQIFKRQKKDSQGDISPFEALMTSLAGAIGTGSIVGVSTAIAIGGLGSLFWMWVTALVGMATKYAESLLAVKYRQVDDRGEMIGGPMQYIEKGLGYTWIAVLFAIFGCVAAIGTGNLIQVNAISAAASTFWPTDPWIHGIVIAILTALVVLGGVRIIGHVAGILVPIMAIFYIGAGLTILAFNYDKIPGVFLSIFSGAFNGQAAFGGFAGASVMMAVQIGVARSIISNEAGLGISTIAAAAAKTDSPARQALITMTGALIATVIVCTITGLVLAVTGVLGQVDENGVMLNGAAMAIHAFNTTISGGAYIVSIGLILFAFSTVIAWAYYGEKCCEYLFGSRSIMYYRIIYTLLVIPGTALKMEAVWLLADITNGLMAIPNLIALVCLSGVIVSETKLFVKIIEKESAASQAIPSKSSLS
jgi:alanine or glycine:cation symporter, AGCS family